MKRLLLITLSLFFFSFLKAQGLNNELKLAFKTGNNKVVSSYFNAKVDITIIDKEGVYSRTQAGLILKDFFSKYSPKNFIELHNGASKSGAYYSIGNLITEKESFRTYILFKNNNDKPLIQELRIETEK